MRTDHACPCCRTPLKRWALSLYQSPVQVYWCGTCLRPVCLEPRAALRPGLPCRVTPAYRLRGCCMPEPAPAIRVLASLGESLRYSLTLPPTQGQVCLPQQWLKDWCVQAQITLQLLDPDGPQRKGDGL